MAKRYICRVYSSHEYAPIDYAVVELDDDLRELLDSVKPQVYELTKVNGQMFLRVEFLNYQPTFIEGLPDAFEEFDDALNCGELVELPGDFEMPDLESCTPRLDFATIQIEDDGFRWTCRVKHSPCEHETVTFNYKDVGWPELNVRE